MANSACINQNSRIMYDNGLSCFNQRAYSKYRYIGSLPTIRFDGFLLFSQFLSSTVAPVPASRRKTFNTALTIVITLPAKVTRK